MRRAAAPAGAPNRRSAPTPVAVAPAMARTTKSTGPRLERDRGLPRTGEPLVERRRAAEEIALRLVDAQPAQQRDRRVVAAELKCRVVRRRAARRPPVRARRRRGTRPCRAPGRRDG